MVPRTTGLGASLCDGITEEHNPFFLLLFRYGESGQETDDRGKKDRFFHVREALESNIEYRSQK